ncbi:MAG TPA: hypothetical protein VKG26_13885 [Bacteroidia bacterium]|nr:hypothetical protein [Bacteroidia bacterium]
MKKIVLAAFIAICTNIHAQNNVVGQMFPMITGETFDGKNVVLPEACKGKPTIIGICFSKAAETDLRTWLNPAYNQFVVKKDTTNAFGAAVAYDINYYFIPMLNLVNQVLEKSSQDKIRKQTDKEFWPHLMFYSGGLKEYKKTFGIDNTDLPYFFVLDKTGKIVHVEKGIYTEKKMNAMEDFLEED